MDSQHTAPKPRAYTAADLAGLAATEHLLVVSDFDGTLAGFASDIYAVKANPNAVSALSALANTPNTTVAVLSGRHLAGLRRVFPLGEPIILGGSHGAETSDGSAGPTPAMAHFLARVDAALDNLIAQYPGANVEVKPFHRVLHVHALAQQDPQAAADALDAAMELDLTALAGDPAAAPGQTAAAGQAESPAQAAGFGRTRGKNVVEFAATSATKGSWIDLQRSRIGATAVVFVGDDVTDETGFLALKQPPDVGVKVGEGDTVAAIRVADIDEAAQFFTDLAKARAEAS